MTKVAIAIINWQQAKLTQETISSLLKIKTPGFSYHIFLLDNGSTDNSFQIFQKKYRHHRQISLFRSFQNLGFSEGNNFLFQKIPLSIYQYVLLLNNDVLLHPFFLKHLLDLAKSTSSASIIGPKIYFAPGFEYHQKRYQPQHRGKVIWSVGGKIDWLNIYGSNKGIDEIDTGQYEQISTDNDFISGCAMLIPSRLLKKLNYFDQRYYMYLEDADLCQRAKKMGAKLIYAPKSIVWHVNSGSTKAGSQIHDYFLTRNRLLFAFKFASLRVKLAVLKQSFSLLRSPSSWQRQAVVDAIIGKWGRGSW